MSNMDIVEFSPRQVASQRKLYSKLKYNRYQRKTIIMETITGWSFLSPVLVVAIIFSTTAIGIALWLTFQKGTFDNLQYVGTANWAKLSLPALELLNATKNTFFFACVSTPVIIVVSVVISGLLNSRLVKKKEVFLAIFFLPQVTSAIAVTLIFKELFSTNGIIKLDYVQNPAQIMWVVIVSAVWGGVAGTLITMNTAFATIDKTQYEAADLDGASGVRKFLNITIPSIGPVVAYSLFMGIIGGLGVFDGPYLLAGGFNLPTEGMMTLVLKGYSYIIPPTAASPTNIGLGTTILFLTAMIMALATFVANLFMPLSRKTN